MLYLYCVIDSIIFELKMNMLINLMINQLFYYKINLLLVILAFFK